MTFGEKVRDLRKQKGLSQTELGKAVGASLRTVRGWEVEGRYPINGATYNKLAEVLDCNVAYFMSDDEALVAEATKRYGHKGAQQAKAVMDEAKALFAGGEISDEDKLAFLQDIQRLFLQSKQDAHDKFTPKKYK